MLTSAPIPRWAEFSQLMLPTRNTRRKISQVWTGDSGGVEGWLSRSSWSLALIANWRRHFEKRKSISVWVPDYFCNESLFLLRQMGVDLCFYPIDNDLTPNYPVVRQLAKDGKPSIFLLVHYFGQPRPTSQAHDFCKKVGAWMVEDAAHVLFPIKGIGSQGDFVLYSPHKVFAVPDGAVLIARPNGVSELGDTFIRNLGFPSEWASQARMALPKLDLNRDNTLWLLKRSLQRCGLVRSAIQIRDHNNDGIRVVRSPEISRFSEKLLGIQLSSLFAARSTRVKNRLLLDYLISQSELSACLVPFAGKASDTFVPYLAQYKTTADENIVHRCREKGLLATTWPDLAPEVEFCPERHLEAITLKRTTILLPVHQSLVPGDFLKIFPPKVPLSTNSSLKDWLGTDEEWNNTLKQADCTNLLQSWEYGEAKRLVSGWNIRRFSLSQDDKLIGVVQVLERRFLGLICIYRINRGPIFLSDSSLDSRTAANHLVRRTFGRLLLGRVLLWAPELTLSGENLALSLYFGFRKRAVQSWSSSVIDLSQTEERLYMTLSGKWRSMLRNAKSKNISIGIAYDKHEFALFASRCAQMLDKRGVKSHVKLTLQLREILSHKPKRDLFLVAYQSDRAIAAIYIVVHGSTATYLMGWNGPEGRVLCAHHLLLWEGIRQLNAMSILHFDLGGIDQENTPGIAAFKLGMGGENYELVGEGICY